MDVVGNLGGAIRRGSDSDQLLPSGARLNTPRTHDEAQVDVKLGTHSPEQELTIVDQAEPSKSESKFLR